MEKEHSYKRLIVQYLLKKKSRARTYCGTPYGQACKTTSKFS